MRRHDYRGGSSFDQPTYFLCKTDKKLAVDLDNTVAKVQEHEIELGLLGRLTTYAFPHIGDRRVHEITGPMIRDILAPSWVSKPETARRVRQRVETVLDWAYASGYRKSEAPMRAITRGLPKQPKKDNHFTAVPYERVAAFLTRLRKKQSFSRLALEFAILTEPALRVIGRCAELRQRGCDLVFPDMKHGAPLSDMTLTKVLALMKEPYTVHGFHSSFQDWVSEETQHQGDIAEAALAHVIPNKTEAAYRSDFDILIIVNDKRLTDKLDNRLIRELAIDKTLKTPVNFIVHTLGEVNDGLAHGRYFFMDVAKDGIALYEADDRPLHTPKPKTPEQALMMAKEYFEEWMPLAASAQKGFLFFLSQKERRDAAIILHQATDLLYHCVLLVCTFYTPHVHNLAFLRTQAERLDMRLVDCWPRELHADRAKLEKLKEAYIKAHYSKHYRISEEELSWPGEQIEELGRIVHTICSERIIELGSNVRL